MTAEFSMLSVEDGQAPPVHWPTLEAAAAATERAALLDWVSDFVERFPHSLKLPPCWAQHNDIVELLSAMRDHERYAFSGLIGAAGAVEWHRAIRDVEARIESWVRRLRCGMPDHPHRPTPKPSDIDDRRR